MNDSSQLSAWFLAGCGIMLDYHGHQLLIDGLFKRPKEAMGIKDGLCDMPEDIRRRILEREVPFSNVEMLLFTHPHWDHCDLTAALSYCHKNGALLLCAEENGTDYTYENEWVKIENFSCPHDEFSNTGNKEHSCFRAELGGKTFLFTGDMDVRHRPIRSELYEKSIDYLFFNVHHLLLPEGRELITGFFKPGQVFIQHLPFPDDDPYGLNRRVTNKLKVFGEELPPCTILNTPMT